MVSSAVVTSWLPMPAGSCSSTGSPNCWQGPGHEPRLDRAGRARPADPAAVLDVSVLYLALPRLGADQDADATQQLWILDIYSFMLAGFLVTIGALGPVLVA
jgi:hypothetical protein